MIKELVNKKYRPTAVIKSYPNHLKVQLFSTEKTKDSSLFEKIIEMEYQEIFDKPLDLSFQHKLEK